MEHLWLNKNKCTTSGKSNSPSKACAQNAKLLLLPMYVRLNSLIIMIFRKINTYHEIFKEFNERDLTNHLENYKIFLDSLINLNETLSEAKVQSQTWEVYGETLTLKFILHANSIYQLYLAPTFPSDQLKRDIRIIDLPSILVLTRSLLENFLMYSHIFVNSKNNDEKEFRFLAWVYSSLLDRQKNRNKRDVLTDEFKKKEKKEIQDYKDQLVNSKYFETLTPKQQNGLIEKGTGKLFRNWTRIIDETQIRDRERWKELYGYLSGFSHSEGLSLAKIRNSYNNNLSYTNEEAVLFCFWTKIMICRMIVEIVNQHKIVEIKFNTFPTELEHKIRTYANISTAS